MLEADKPRFNLDAILAEIAEDEKVDLGAKRLLSQEDIRRLVEESRRRREREPAPKGKPA
jgi:hypothetical protein